MKNANSSLRVAYGVVFFGMGVKGCPFGYEKFLEDSILIETGYIATEL